MHKKNSPAIPSQDKGRKGKKHCHAIPSQDKGRKGKSPDRLIFTDLDGTLLDHDTYSWKPADQALKAAGKAGVPVIFCTSKNRSEIEAIRERMGNRHPFIAENGEAFFIPEGCFRRRPAGAKKKGRYLVIELGKPYKELREVMKRMQKKGLKVRGFGDMTNKEVSRLTGLTEKESGLARKREYDEPFLIEKRAHESKVRTFIRKQGLQVTKGGRFWHLASGSGKGLAVKMLTSMYGTEVDITPVTAGLGDSPNDFSMLRAVHVPYLLQGSGGKHAPAPEGFIRVDRKGPEGWNIAVLKFMGES
jgi:mannosyl-3-phosphoglycerate phosphatase